MKEAKTYLDKLIQDKEFREKLDKEYKNLWLTEQIAKNRHYVKGDVKDWLKPEEDDTWQDL